MSKSICGIDCDICNMNQMCGGCCETNGKPFGGSCIAAEYIKVGGKDSFEEFKKQIIREFNELGIDDMPQIDNLHCLCGAFVNLEYPLPSGEKTKFLDDKKVYLGTQVDSLFNDRIINKRYGLIADMGFLLVSEYTDSGENPAIVVFKRR